MLENNRRHGTGRPFRPRAERSTIRTLKLSSIPAMRNWRTKNYGAPRWSDFIAAARGRLDPRPPAGCRDGHLPTALASGEGSSLGSVFAADPGLRKQSPAGAPRCARNWSAAADVSASRSARPRLLAKTADGRRSNSAPLRCRSLPCGSGGLVKTRISGAHLQNKTRPRFPAPRLFQPVGHSLSPGRAGQARRTHPAVTSKGAPPSPCRCKSRKSQAPPPSSSGAHCIVPLVRQANKHFASCRKPPSERISDEARPLGSDMKPSNWQLEACPSQ